MLMAKTVEEDFDMQAFEEEAKNILDGLPPEPEEEKEEK